MTFYLGLYFSSFWLALYPLVGVVGLTLPLTLEIPVQTTGYLTAKKNISDHASLSLLIPVMAAYCKRWTSNWLNSWSCWKTNHGSESFCFAGRLQKEPAGCTLLSVLCLIKKDQRGRVSASLSPPTGRRNFLSMTEFVLMSMTQLYESLTAVYGCEHMHLWGKEIVVLSREERCPLAWALLTGNGCMYVSACARVSGGLTMCILSI